MRRLLLLVPLLAAACAAQKVGAITVTPVGFYTSLYEETQTCTAGTCAGTTPSSTAVGASMAWVNNYRLRVCAASGQTLSGAGTMQTWFCDVTSRLCYRDPGLDQGVSVSGQQCQLFPDLTVGYITPAADTVEYVASGVTVSGGAALTVDILTYRQRQP